MRGIQIGKPNSIYIFPCTNYQFELFNIYSRKTSILNSAFNAFTNKCIAQYSFLDSSAAFIAAKKPAINSFRFDSISGKTSLANFFICDDSDSNVQGQACGKKGKPEDEQTWFNVLPVLEESYNILL
mmetsp:Transcript_8030/g.12022  ORF Transcript_8030/g.12022 Transcript_8030/m.12022 type:complete len:127 (-) Transcript_8030:1119-1499(-)